MRPGLLIVVSGPAGVGKGSVIKRVKELSDEVVFSVSATSRKPRPGEIEGVNYFFKTREQFEEMIRQQSLIEWVDYCGNYYGTPKEFVRHELEKGHNIILEIDVAGSLRVQEMFSDCIPCFIVPPSYEELEKRLRLRKTEDEETIQKRLNKAKEEFKYLHHYDYIIINDTLDEAAEMFISIVHAERMKTSRNHELIDSFKNV